MASKQVRTHPHDHTHASSIQSTKIDDWFSTLECSGNISYRIKKKKNKKTRSL